MIRVHPLARLVELRLLIWVATFSLVGYVAVVAAASGRFAWYEIAVPLAVLGVFGALHVFLVAVGFRGDQLLLPLAVGLTGIGFVLVERLAPTLLLQQLSWLVIAAGAFCVTILVPRDLSALARFKYTWALIGIILLVSPLLPVVGREINGARIWVGVTGVAQFEPWELVKIALVIFFAAYLEEYREVLSTPPRRLGPIPVPPIPYLLPIVAMWLVAMLVMVFEKDLGATLLFFGIFLAMLFVATGRRSYVLIGLLLFVAAAFLAYELFPHVARRIDVWLDPFADPLDAGFQQVRALYALGRGGVFGEGLGQGLITLGGSTTIPYIQTDFIFTAVAEELGLVGSLALLGFIAAMVFRGLRIAASARDDFSALLALGLTVSLGLQALIIIGGNTKLVPLTGITLPFVSYGGSSILASFIMIGLLLSISHRSVVGEDPPA